jgi:hypothetical protein
MEARRVACLRQQQQALREQAQAVSVQFHDALRLFPPHSDAADRQDPLADARAVRLFGVLRCCAENLLGALEACQTAEDALLGEAAASR